MADVTKAMERFAEVFPWRTTLALLAVSFLAATVTSTVVGHLFVKNETKSAVTTSGRRIGAPATPTTTTASLNVPQPTASLNQASIDSILKRNLFNSEGAAEDSAEKQQKQQTNEITKSDLPVKLVGTIYGGDPLSGIALVENNQKKTINSFMVNDTLLKDVTVKEIHVERIIVDHSGHLEYIEVVQEGLNRSRRKKKAAVATSSDTIAPIATEPPPTSFKEEGFERKERDINMTQAYRSKLLTTDFTKVLQDAKATPNMVNGELQGFKLDRIRKDSIWEKSGFQNDDIITEVNGVPLTDTAQAIRLLQSLRNETEIEVRGTRGGAPLKFNLNIH